MALVLDATIGGAASNSYDTLANAEIYFEGRLNKANWDSQTDGDKDAALVHATTILDAEPYDGLKASTTQRLKWPRVEVLDDDDIEIASTIIPKEMKEAIFELALVLFGSDIQSHTGLEKFDELVVGPIELKPKADAVNILPDEVTKLIGRFQGISTMSVRVRGT